jgi:methanogenic corrinoid protein MtbC1
MPRRWWTHRDCTGPTDSDERGGRPGEKGRHDVSDDILLTLNQSLVDLEEERVSELTSQALAAGVDPLTIIQGGLTPGMSRVGKLFEEGEYYLPELLIAAETFKAAVDLVKPHLAEAVQTKGTVVLGTVEGDIHDIGKDMVHMLMDINGFEVRGLGVDVPARRFCGEYKDFQPDIVGLSGLLTLSYDSMKAVVECLKEIGARDKVKVIIGGGQVDEHACKYVEADAWVTDAVAGVKYALQWMESQA